MVGRSKLNYVSPEVAFYLSGVWSVYEEGFYKQLVFRLCYSMSQGSGLNFNYTECMEMPLSDAIAFAELLNEARTIEAEAMRPKK